MFRQCTPLFLAMLCVVVVPTVTSADGPNDVCDSQPTDLADIEIVADWIKSLQYTEESLPSYGAITIHHTPGYVAPNGDVYFRVVPYFSNLGLWGLLQAPVTGRLELAERWITWYLSHLDTNGPPPGVIYDHWYLGDGAGETTCPPGIAPSLCDHDDASDSYAATFLGVAWAY